MFLSSSVMNVKQELFLWKGEMISIMAFMSCEVPLKSSATHVHEAALPKNEKLQL